MDPFVIASAVAIQVFDLEWVQKFVLLLSQECEEGATDAVVENLIEEIFKRELHAITNVNLNEQEEDGKMAAHVAQNRVGHVVIWCQLQWKTRVFFQWYTREKCPCPSRGKHVVKWC
jgi:hypothetical protein